MTANRFKGERSKWRDARMKSLLSKQYNRKTQNMEVVAALVLKIIIYSHVASAFILHDCGTELDQEQSRDKTLRRFRRKVTNKDINLWPDGVIPYVIHGEHIYSILSSF